MKRGGSLLAAAAVLMVFVGTAEAQSSKPNVLVIWGDDIGV